MDEVAELQGEALPETTTGEDVIENSSTSEVEETTQEETPADEQPKKAKGVQKRLDELTALRRDAERDRDYWRELALREKKAEQPKAEPAAQSTEKPKLDDFASYEEYTEALTDWKVEQKLSSRSEAEKKAQAEAERQTAMQYHGTREAAFRESHPDYDQVAGNPRLPITEAMAEAAFTSEKGPELLYHLGKNPQEAARIAALSPYQAAMELRLEARLARPQKTQTGAPDPITPISGIGGGQTSTLETARSMDEYARLRRKQMTGK